MKLRYLSSASLFLALVGCNGAGDAAQTSTQTTMKTAQVQPQGATDLKSNVKKKPTTPGKVKIATRTKPAEYHWGCNYNTSCKLNCEWCGVGGTCTCRLKGVD